MQPPTTGPNRWTGAWLDAVAFSIGLGLAWWLIFFFAGAHAAKLDGFLVYAVVYAVYFSPWRVFRREKVAQDAPVTA